MREWPITKWWYTRKKGLTIEETIDKDVDWFLWAVKTFQNITPKQAIYFEKKFGKRIDNKYIQDVQPYEWQSGDSDDLYMELCKTQDFENTLLKYRGKQLSIF